MLARTRARRRALAAGHRLQRPARAMVLPRCCLLMLLLRRRRRRKMGNLHRNEIFGVASLTLNSDSKPWQAITPSRCAAGLGRYANNPDDAQRPPRYPTRLSQATERDIILQGTFDWRLWDGCGETAVAPRAGLRFEFCVPLDVRKCV